MASSVTGTSPVRDTGGVALPFVTSQMDDFLNVVLAGKMDFGFWLHYHSIVTRWETVAFSQLIPKSIGRRRSANHNESSHPLLSSLPLRKGAHRCRVGRATGRQRG